MDNQSINKVGFAFLSGALLGSGIISILVGLYNIYDLNISSNGTSNHWYYLITGTCAIFASRLLSNKKNLFVR